MMIEDHRGKRHAASDTITLSTVSRHAYSILCKVIMAKIRFVKDWQGLHQKVSLRENKRHSPEVAAKDLKIAHVAENYTYTSYFFSNIKTKSITITVLFKRSSVCITFAFFFFSFIFLPPSLSIPDVKCLSGADSMWHRCPIHCSEQEMVFLATITTQKPGEFSLIPM